MPEIYRGYELNVPKDKKWGQRENAFHKKLIDNVIDGTIGPQGPRGYQGYRGYQGSSTGAQGPRGYQGSRGYQGVRGYQGATGPQPVVPTLNNNRYVSPSGNDSTGDGSIVKPFKTISGALAAIHDNSTTNPYCIYLAGGRYVESTTLNVGEGIHVLGTGDSTVITTSNNNIDLFNLFNQSDVSKLTIVGPTNAKSVSITDAGAIISLREIKFSNCAYPIYINAVSSDVNLFDIALRGNSVPIVNGITILSGDVKLYTLTNINTLGTNIIYASGSNTSCHAWGIDNDSTTMNTIAYITDSADISLNDSHSNGGTTGIYLNDAYIKITSVELLNYSIGIDIGETGTAYLLMDSVYIDKSSTWDLRVQNSNSVVRGLNNFLHDSLISFTNGTPAIEYALSHFSNDLGSETSITKSAFAVGAPLPSQDWGKAMHIHVAC